MVGALGVLLAAAWLDSWLLPGAQRRAAATFDVGEVYPLFTMGTIAVGGACLLVGWLGSRAAPLVGASYAIVGGFLAGLQWWLFGFGASGDGERPLIPEPVTRAMTDLLFLTNGPLGAVAVIGGAMLVTGVVSLVRWLRARRAVASPPVVESSVGA